MQWMADRIHEFTAIGLQKKPSGKPMIVIIPSWIVGV